MMRIRPEGAHLDPAYTNANPSAPHPMRTFYHTPFVPRPCTGPASRTWPFNRLKLNLPLSSPPTPWNPTRTTQMISGGGHLTVCSITLLSWAGGEPTRRVCIDPTLVAQTGDLVQQEPPFGNVIDWSEGQTAHLQPGLVLVAFAFDAALEHVRLERRSQEMLQHQEGRVHGH
jgi:hypothetical protein